MRKKILMMIVLTFLGTTTLLAMGRRVEGALNPTLLWEKEFDGVVVDEGVNLARISGDAIVSLKESGAEQIDRVLIFNTTGQLVQEWKNACYGRISDDGNKVIYLTPYSADSFYDKVHYATKDGQEIWWKQHGGDAHISPDGNLVIEASTAMESTQLIEVFDTTGKQIWSYKVAESLRVVFSPGSDYIGVSGGNAYDPINKIRIYRRDGAILWGKERSDMGISSISEEANFISTVKFICDKMGNIVFEGNWVDVVDSGKMFVSLSSENIEVRTLPDKSVLREYPIRNLWFKTHKTSKGDISMSHEGRYLVLFGERTDILSQNNLFVLDTQTNEVWETKIEPVGESESGLMQVFLTRDGKYMLVQAEGKLYYYQIY